MDIVHQFAFDFDWFFVDEGDHLCHVASAAGRLPERVSVLEVEELQSMSSTVRQLPTRFEYEINPQLEEFKFFENELQRLEYLSDFIEFAKRGLYSFDKSNINSFEHSGYHLVAYPKKDIILGSPNFKLTVKNDIVDFDKFRVNSLFIKKRSFQLKEIDFIE